LLLVDGAGQFERLKDGELGGPEAGGTEFVVVELGEGPGCAAERGAHAGEGRDGGLRHIELDVYASNFGRRFLCPPKGFNSQLFGDELEWRRSFFFR